MKKLLFAALFALMLASSSAPLLAVDWNCVWNSGTCGEDTWTARTFDAADFTASTGTWTLQSGDQVLFKYQIRGKTMTIMLWLQTTTVSNDTANLKILIPASKVANVQASAALNYTTAGSLGTGMCFTLGTSQFIWWQRDFGASVNFLTGTNNTGGTCTITFEIQ